MNEQPTTPMEGVTPAIVTPEVVVDSDYGGYFERYVRRLIARKLESGQAFKSKKVLISSGPWRSYDISWNVNGEDSILELDFYSAARNRGINADEEIMNLL